MSFPRRRESIPLSVIARPDLSRRGNHYLKRNTKYSILAFLIILLCINISIPTLAKTEVYFSLSDNPQKEIIKNINQAQTFINISMYIFSNNKIARK